MALATIKFHGEHLEDVVLAGVEGLHQTIKLPVALDTHFARLGLMVEQDGTLGDERFADLASRVFDKSGETGWPRIAPINTNNLVWFHEISF